ncbi:MAG: formyltransferase [Rhodocyclaceae bacterium]|jgi:methionyl-tRNA formyltransferase|nr:formyltransferase [Rhodocyclaceae bacterium]
MTRAVVFAYHNVGVRCLSVLLARGIEVPLVLTHRDNPDETIWFDSVAELCALHDIPAIMPDDPNAPDTTARIAALQPDFLFSFYYRRMLQPGLLQLAQRGAYNLHGSLLPRYRGRVPVNWAVIRGERETGATLHRMVEKPDAGAIVAQQAVPILPDDTALAVFNKVTVAAEMALDRVLPQLVAGTAPHVAQDLARGSYFGGRRPEDGRIDWNDTAETVHNLVRGVAPPYPGAFTEIAGKNLRILKTLRQPGRRRDYGHPALFAENGRCYAQCADGSVLRIVEIELDGRLASPDEIERQFKVFPIFLSTTGLSAP